MSKHELEMVNGAMVGEVPVISISRTAQQHDPMKGTGSGSVPHFTYFEAQFA
jgi:hypothetical protein